MRKISANYVFPVSSPPVKNGIIVLGDQDRIMEIVNPGSHFRETAGLEFYNGVLVPSFIVFAEYGRKDSVENTVEAVFYKLAGQFKNAGCKIVILSFNGKMFLLDIPAETIREITQDHSALKPAFIIDEDRIISLFDFFPPATNSTGELWGLELFIRQLKHVTLDVAVSVGLQKETGSFDIGKKPGIQLISPYDFEQWSPAKDARIQILVK